MSILLIYWVRNSLEQNTILYLRYGDQIIVNGGHWIVEHSRFSYFKSRQICQMRLDHLLFDTNAKEGNAFSHVCPPFCPQEGRCTGPQTLPYVLGPAPTPPRHVQTCSTLTSLYMFKFVHYEARTVGKRAVRI